MSDAPFEGEDPVDRLLAETFGLSAREGLPWFPEYVDRQGAPLSMKQWAVLFARPEYKRVASTTLRGLWVSTVWLGMNHAPMDGGEYFETMVFNESRRHRHRPWADRYTGRYGTEAEALRGHQRLVEQIRQRGVTALGSYTQRKRAEEEYEYIFRALMVAA